MVWSTEGNSFNHDAIANSLAAYLAVKDYFQCGCGLDRETIEHVLMVCDRCEDEIFGFDLSEKDVATSLGCDELTSKLFRRWRSENVTIPMQNMQLSA